MPTRAVIEADLDVLDEHGTVLLTVCGVADSAPGSPRTERAIVC